MFRRRRIRKAAERISEAHLALKDVSARGAIAFAAQGTPEREALRLQYEQASNGELKLLLEANERGLEIYMSEGRITSGKAPFDPIATGMMERINVLTRMLAERSELA